MLLSRAHAGSSLLAIAIAAVHLAVGCSGGSHGTTTPESVDAAAFTTCTPGGDGSYVEHAFSTLDAYCLAGIVDGGIQYASSVIPYDLNTPLFSDGATKARAVFVPPGKKATYDADGAFDFPTGSVLIKSFGFPADARVQPPVVHWLETRLIIKADDGWHAYPYLWDASGTTATYNPGGRTMHASGVDVTGHTFDQPYLQPAQTQCKQCHESSGVLLPIGPKARNLNRDFTYASGTENQLLHWTNAGILGGAPSNPDAAPRLAMWNDPTQSTETRARAYLEGNCAHCHNDAGSASTSGLFLFASEKDPLRYGVCKEPLSAGGMVGARQWDVVPGDPQASILWYRMSSVAPGVAMPQIGRDVVDTEGLALVSDWIKALPAAPCAR